MRLFKKILRPKAVRVQAVQSGLHPERSFEHTREASQNACKQPTVAAKLLLKIFFSNFFL